MNKNLIFSVILVLVLGLGLWGIMNNTGPRDAIAPTATLSPTSASTPSPLANSSLTITSPKNNALVVSPVTVTGKARVFENQFMIRVKDSAGKVVYQKEAVMSDAKESGLWGNYSVQIPLPSGSGATFKIEALDYSAKGDGSLAGYASVTVRLQ